MTFWPKMGGFVGKIGEGVVRYWPPMNLFFLLGVYTSVPILVKIDQEMRLWECSQTDTHTHRLTHWQTQTDFIICPMLYCIAMGQIIILQLFSRISAVSLSITVGSTKPWDNRVDLRSAPSLTSRAPTHNVLATGLNRQCGNVSHSYNKKLIRRWDSERELSLWRHCTRTKSTILLHKFRHRSFSATHVYQLQWNNAM